MQAHSIEGDDETNRGNTPVFFGSEENLGRLILWSYQV
jgi:hypothetical protein